MFCQNCGAKTSDESLHCPECGAKIETPIELGPGVDSAAGCRESATSPSGGASNGSGGEPRKRKRIAVIAVMAVLLVIGLAFGVSACQANAQRTAKHHVTFAVNAEGLDTSTGTLIPLSVKGTDVSGNWVEESCYVGNDSASLDLVAGTYTFEVTASPIAADGTLYSIEGAYAEETVGEDGTLSPGEAITLKPLPAGKTTYKQIEDAYEAAKNGGAASEEAASKLKDAATKRVDAAKAQQSASGTSGQTMKSESASGGDASSKSTADAEGTYSGTVYVFASDAEMAEALGIENPNGPSSIKIATAVMKLDSAKTVKAKNGDGSGSRSGTAHYLVLAHGTGAGSWTSYNGKHVSVSAPSLAWPSDTRVPLGEPGVVGSASVVG